MNARFGRSGVQPIMLRESHHEPSDVHRLYRAADFCYVGSLRDGMNLVAKEFVGARDDERGVLILSQATGAALQLREALLINPWALESSSDAVVQALTMPEIEQTNRMRMLRGTVARSDVGWWARSLLADAASVHGADDRAADVTGPATTPAVRLSA